MTMHLTSCRRLLQGAGSKAGEDDKKKKKKRKKKTAHTVLDENAEVDDIDNVFEVCSLEHTHSQVQPLNPPPPLPPHQMQIYL